MVHFPGCTIERIIARGYENAVQKLKQWGRSGQSKREGGPAGIVIRRIKSNQSTIILLPE